LKWEEREGGERGYEGGGATKYWQRIVCMGIQEPARQGHEWKEDKHKVESWAKEDERGIEGKMFGMLAAGLAGR
jgi:hypothetical protein